MKHYFSKMKTPVGELTLVADARHLIAVLWEEDDPDRVWISGAEEKNDHPILKRTRKQLGEYFSRKRTAFNIAYRFSGTPFQNRVWRELSRIPYGERRTYLDIAKKIGSRRACRAVGAANGRNPLSIIVPCHRVIGSDGSLTGFAGGIKLKKILLDLESSPRSGLL